MKINVGDMAVINCDICMKYRVNPISCQNILVSVLELGDGYVYLKFLESGELCFAAKGARYNNDIKIRKATDREKFLYFTHEICEFGE